MKEDYSKWAIPYKFRRWWYICDGKYIYASRSFTGKYKKIGKFKETK